MAIGSRTTTKQLYRPLRKKHKITKPPSFFVEGPSKHRNVTQEIAEYSNNHTIQDSPANPKDPSPDVQESIASIHGPNNVLPGETSIPNVQSKPNNAKNTELKELETKNAESITLTTLNVQSFRSNKVCISKLLESTDILCIQEHWLFTFEKEEIAELTNTHSVYSKASDQYENISPQERTRGHGGVAIFWHNTLDRYVKTEEDGNNRIVCIQLQNEHQKLLLINVYTSMPCRNTHTGDNFNETLDQLQELLAKYRPTHHIIICEDINASLHRTPPNRQDQQLKAFSEEVNLSCNEETQPEHSFHHHNGLHSAKIDYILFGEESGDIVRKAAIINSVDPFSVSDHKPVTCKLKF